MGYRSLYRAAIGVDYSDNTMPSNSFAIQGMLGIQTDTPTSPVDVRTSNTVVNSSGATGQVFVGASNNRSINLGGTLYLGGSSTTASFTKVAYASVCGRAENSTNSNSAGYLQFNTTNSAGTTAEWMRITSTGAVGFNTTTPLSRLDVGGSIAIGSYAGTTVAPSNGLLCSGVASIGTNSSVIIDTLNLAQPTANGFTGISFGENNATILWTIRTFYSDQSIRFGDGGVYQVVIQQTSGNVGLGNLIFALNRLDVSGAQVIGASYAGVNTAPTNGLLVQGNVGIGTTSLSSSAALQITSTTQGVRFPNMTEAQRDAIGSPVAGLVIYNTTTNKLNVYTTAWEAITSI